MAEHKKTHSFAYMKILINLITLPILFRVLVGINKNSHQPTQAWLLGYLGLKI